MHEYGITEPYIIILNRKRARKYVAVDSDRFSIGRLGLLFGVRCLNAGMKLRIENDTGGHGTLVVLLGLCWIAIPRGWMAVIPVIYASASRYFTINM